MAESNVIRYCGYYFIPGIAATIQWNGNAKGSCYETFAWTGAMF